MRALGLSAGVCATVCVSGAGECATACMSGAGGCDGVPFSVPWMVRGRPLLRGWNSVRAPASCETAAATTISADISCQRVAPTMDFAPDADVLIILPSGYDMLPLSSTIQKRVGKDWADATTCCARPSGKSNPSISAAARAFVPCLALKFCSTSPESPGAAFA